MSEKQNTTPEEFRKVEDFPDYSVSNHARVRRDAVYYKAVKNKIMTTRTNWAGYWMINLRRGHERKTAIVSRLVAKAFVPNPLNLPFVNHKDGVKSNNDPSNLEWCTDAENRRHAVIHGLTAKGDRHGSHLHPERWARGDNHYSRRHPEKMKRGEQNNKARLNNSKVQEIRTLHSRGVSTHKLARIFNVTRRTIMLVVKRMTWKHVP